MAKLVDLVPNGGTHTGTPAPGLTAAQALGDGNTSTGVSTAPGSPGATGSAVMAMSTYTLAEDERCAHVRARWYIRNAGMNLSIAPGLAGSPIGDGYDTFGPGAIPGLSWHAGYWKTGPGPGGELAQSNIDDIQYLSHWAGASGYGSPYIDAREYRIQLRILRRPVAAMAAVGLTSNVAGEFQANMAWTYTGHGESQTRYRAKVFTQSVASDPDFDPDTSDAAYDSGVVASSATSVVTGPLAAGDSYVAMVKVSKSFNAGHWDSNWSGQHAFAIPSTPVVTVTEPTGVVSLTDSPMVQWTFSDASGGSQSRFQLAIFERPGASWSGFDPDAATPVFARALSSTATSWPAAGPLPNNAVLRAYVRAAKVVSGIEYWSDWAFTDFSTDFVRPGLPTFTATDHGDRVELVVTPNSGDVSAPDWINVYRSVEGGPWELFRTGDGTPSGPVTAGSFASVALWDQEPPLGREVAYRAEVVSTATGGAVASDPVERVVVPSAVVVWLKDPNDMSLGVHVPVSDRWINFTKDIDPVVIRPLGRRLPVVVRRAYRGSTTSLTWLAQSREDHDALLALLESGRTLLLQTPKGNLFVEVAGEVVVSGHLWDLKGGYDSEVWQITAPFVEVDY